MSLLGEKSVSSTLGIVLKVVWYIGIAVLLISVGLIIIDLINPSYFIDKVSFGLKLQVMGLRLNVSSASIQPPRITLSMLIICAVMPFSLCFIYQLRKIFESLTHNKPFTLENSKRLKIMSILLIIGSLAYSLASFAVGSLYLHDTLDQLHLPDLEITYALHFNFEMLYFGIVLLILAEIFHHGCLLQEEVDFTV